MIVYLETHTQKFTLINKYVSKSDRSDDDFLLNIFLKYLVECLVKYSLSSITLDSVIEEIRESFSCDLNSSLACSSVILFVLSLLDAGRRTHLRTSRKLSMVCID